ncbi:MAG: PVC-type heme-binding CxxCH protein [Bryobacteraceae bacterium]
MKKIGFVLAAAAAGFVAWRSGWLRTGPPAEKRGLASITVPEGFTVELAAKPGLVRYPMLGTIAPDGAMYMCESSGKTMKTPEMSAAPDYVVTKLEDTDHDGVYDKTTTFAEKLTLPAGAVWYRGSLYVAAPPKVIRLQDTNGDGVADVQEVVVEGWNLSANAASLHGPIMGPDGWLYLTDGRHGFNIKTKDGRKYEGKASRIWRIRPDGTGLEVFAGGGFDNPVEVVFTEAGDVFGTMTYFRDPSDGQRDSILHFVEGGVYPKPHPAMDEFKRTGDLMPVMTKFARIAPSGLLRYRGTSFGGDFQGNLFTAQFNSHRVQRHEVSRDGSTFKTKDSDFFVAADADLHPTDVMEDADGSLIVVDTGAWFIHGCPLSRVSKPDVLGMLYRVRRNGAPKVDDPRGEKIQPLTAALLDDPRPVVHDRALEGLVAAGAASVPALSKMRAEAKSVRGATSAVFALSRIGDTAAVRAALDDQRFEVRQAAARQLGMAGDKDSVKRLSEILLKDEPTARRQAATALGQIGDPAAVPALIEATGNPGDRFLEHAIIYSLIQLGKASAQPLMSKLSDPAAPVRKAALIALDQMEASPLREQNVLAFVNDKDPELRRMSLWVVSRHPAWSARFTEALLARVQHPEFSDSEAEMVQDAIGAFCGEASMKKQLGGLLGGASLDTRRHLLLLDAAERCSNKEFPAEWTAGLAKLLEHPDPAVRVKTIALARARGVAALDAELRKLADSSAQPDDVRVAALSALGSRQPKLSDADFSYLISRVAPKVEANTKLAAGQVLGRAEYTDAQLLDIAAKQLAAADPLVLPNLLDAFRNSNSEAVGQALVKALEKVEGSLGVIGTQRVQDVVAKFPDPVKSAAKPLLARMEAERNQRLEKLKKLEATLAAKGDVQHGREVFFGAKAGCSGCHTIGLQGGHVGPDLTSIGAIRSPHDLLEAIVLPSESFVPGHEVYRVQTEREIYSGVMGKSTPDAIRLITGPGDEVRIPRKDVKKMGFAPVSLMPEGYEDVLSRAELTDLIGFLRSQTTRPL